MSEEAEKLTGVIPDFFYNLISHVGSGVIVVALFLQDLLPEHVGMELLIPCWLIGSWTIGLTLEIFSGELVKLIMANFPKVRVVAEKRGVLFDLENSDTLAFSLSERRTLIKFNAEAVFFRIMTCVSVYSALCPPRFVASHFNQPCFEPYIIGICGTAISCVCWLSKHNEFQNHRILIQKRNAPNCQFDG